MNRFYSLTAHAFTPLLAVVALSFIGNAAQAQVTVFNDRTAFTAATTGLTLIDFNDQVTPPDLFISYPGNTVTLSGVTFTGDAILFAVTPAYSIGYGFGDDTVLSAQGATPNTFTISLPAGTTAVGTDFGAFGSSAFTFTLSTGDVFVLNGQSSPTVTFAGFTSVAPITSLTLSSNDAGPQIDRFLVGGAAPVPEPGSVALLTGLSLTGAGFLRRRKAAREVI